MSNKLLLNLVVGICAAALTFLILGGNFTLLLQSAFIQSSTTTLVFPTSTAGHQGGVPFNVTINVNDGMDFVGSVTNISFCSRTGMPPLYSPDFANNYIDFAFAYKAKLYVNGRSVTDGWVCPEKGWKLYESVSPRTGAVRRAVSETSNIWCEPNFDFNLEEVNRNTCCETGDTNSTYTLEVKVLTDDVLTSNSAEFSPCLRVTYREDPRNSCLVQGNTTYVETSRNCDMYPTEEIPDVPGEEPEDNQKPKILISIVVGLLAVLITNSISKE